VRVRTAFRRPAVGPAVPPDEGGFVERKLRPVSALSSGACIRPQSVPQGTEYALRTYCINFFSDV